MDLEVDTNFSYEQTAAIFRADDGTMVQVHGAFNTQNINTDTWT